jgi:hypothetical protein
MTIKVIKFFIIPLLHFIRKVLNVLKKHMLPDIVLPPKRTYYNAFEMYLKEEEVKSYNYFKKFFKSSIFLNENDIKTYAIKFGVFQGKSINFFSNILKEKKFYGFDSFEGLNEDWEGSEYPKGYFNLKGKLPKVNNNVELVKGKVQDTLKNFINTRNPKISFVHIDLDTYESTKFVLSEIKKNLLQGSIILFDELYNFAGWDVGEYKALNEIFSEKEFKFLAFSKNGCQAVIQIL